MNLGLITCHFNPLHYRRPVENYWRFVEGLGRHAEHLTTVELVYDDDPPAIPDAIHVMGRRNRHLLWQKEALLNCALRKLNPRYDAVAWLDADIQFENSDWYEITTKELKRHSLLQLFESAAYLNADGSTEEELSSAGFVHHRGLERVYGQPGLAWATRREILEPQGFLDAHPIGGNDSLMKDCWLGKWNGWSLRRASPKLREYSLRWGEQQWPKVRGDLAAVPGRIRHLFHGSRKNRRYGERDNYLNQLDFDPKIDLVRDENGLLAWSGAKPELAKAVTDWFSLRREDE